MSAAADGSRPLRVVVCGTTFGQVYLEGLRGAGPDFELAGIVSRGSRRSAACAEHYGVPLYAGPDELPADVDVACVVIRAGLLGGQGAQLAQRLMERGIHVIQEHPLHHDELAACLRAARSAGVVYRLNSFYPHVAPVRRFLAAARELFRRRSALYVDAACGFQLAYSLLDVVGRALGGIRPWALGDPSPLPDELVRLNDVGEMPFRSLDGVVGGIPLVLRVQNQMDPSDPDNHAHYDHRITFGTDGGNLTLVNTHGPVVWSLRPRYPHDPRDPDAGPHFAGPVADASPSAVLIGPGETPSFPQIFRTYWPPAVRRALADLRQAILAGEDPLRRGQAQLSLCLLWQDVTARLGPPDLIRRESPRPLAAAELAEIARAGAEAEAEAEAVA